MKTYDVTLKGFKLNTIKAKDDKAALEKAVYLYGLEVDIVEVC